MTTEILAIAGMTVAILGSILAMTRSLHGEIKATRTELSEDIQAVRDELTSKIDNLNTAQHGLNERMVGVEGLVMGLKEAIVARAAA